MLDFTVAIRTYNSEVSLPKVLDKLKIQVGIEEIKWEIIIVDNNSSDRTLQIIQYYQSNWNFSYPFRCYADSVAACQITLLLSILISPLFLTWVKLKNYTTKQSII